MAVFLAFDLTGVLTGMDEALQDWCASHPFALCHQRVEQGDYPAIDQAEIAGCESSWDLPVGESP
ncbi:MAG TPA: hypothetical protein VIY86_10780, partial [Pirellulaceae bacterium]